MNNNRNNNNNNFPSPQGDYLVLYIENVINTAILLRNRSQRVNPSRDRSPRLIPSCKLYRGPVPATGPCDQSLRLVPSCVATLRLIVLTSTSEVDKNSLDQNFCLIQILRRTLIKWSPCRVQKTVLSCRIFEKHPFSTTPVEKIIIFS